MKNNVSAIVAILAMIVALSSNTTAYAAENEFISVAKTTTEAISMSSIESTSVVETYEAGTPVLALATISADNAEMEAQVILGDGSFRPSNREAIEERKDYTFVVSGLDMSRGDFGNIVLTFDFAGSKFLGEDIEDIDLDITEFKIDDVSFNVSNANYHKEQYDGGFNLFNIIKADAEAYTNAFYENGHTNNPDVKVDKIVVGVHINTLKIKNEEFATTTTTSIVSDISTTTGQTSTVVSNNTTSTSSTQTTSTTKTDKEVNSPDTGDTGVGLAIAILSVSLSLAYIAKKRRK